MECDGWSHAVNFIKIISFLLFISTAFKALLKINRYTVFFVSSVQVVMLTPYAQALYCIILTVIVMWNDQSHMTVDAIDPVHCEG